MEGLVLVNDHLLSNLHAMKLVKKGLSEDVCHSSTPLKVAMAHKKESIQ